MGVWNRARLQETQVSVQGLASMVGSSGKGMNLPGVDGLLCLACPWGHSPSLRVRVHAQGPCRLSRCAHSTPPHPALPTFP